MKKVGIRELKDKLSAYVREAQAGEVVQVTDHGHVVAELRAPGEPVEPQLSPREVRYRRLVARGVLRPAKEPRGPIDWPQFKFPAGTADRLLDEDREDGST